MDKEAKNYKKYLKSLTESVIVCLNAFDTEMKKPATIERGKRIAKICNALEMENDKARYFGLGVDYRKDKKPIPEDSQ